MRSQKVGLDLAVPHAQRRALLRRKRKQKGSFWYSTRQGRSTRLHENAYLYRTKLSLPYGEINYDACLKLCTYSFASLAKSSYHTMQKS
mmetsp:Transcript_31758/g.51246  ORF Transcript_31758/g.51246 Transcript_31758/m.51246 type:complete len:89 (-) Transcript_31758:315-581(-)